jgi:hypothetical protein
MLPEMDFTNLTQHLHSAAINHAYNGFVARNLKIGGNQLNESTK